MIAVRRTTVLALAAVLTVICVLTAGGVVFLQPRFILHWPSDRDPEVIFFVPTEEKIIALTIDDGPGLIPAEESRVYRSQKGH